MTPWYCQELATIGILGGRLFGGKQVMKNKLVNGVLSFAVVLCLVCVLINCWGKGTKHLAERRAYYEREAVRQAEAEAEIEAKTIYIKIVRE